MRQVYARNPPFAEAVLADAQLAAQFRGGPPAFRSRREAVLYALRLSWESDSFLAQVAYRARATLLRRGVPVLPRILHSFSMMSAQISIGNPVVLEPGVYIPHGQIVLDGLVEIGQGSVLAPWVSIGLRSGHFRGPKLGREVKVGSGATLLGPFDVGDGASIGPNAIVFKDVPAGGTVIGPPAAPFGP
jgi:serine O-acetyltransferase